MREARTGALIFFKKKKKKKEKKKKDNELTPEGAVISASLPRINSDDMTSN